MRGGWWESPEVKQHLTRQQAHLVSTAHHAVNTNNLLSVSMTLPFHPAALWSPLPAAKEGGGGPTSVAGYLPPFDKASAQLVAGGAFARPLLAGTSRTLAHMFDDAGMLALMADGVAAAAEAFRADMEAFAAVVGARTFGPDGLSQGMPFVWQAMDPSVAPYSITI